MKKTIVFTFVLLALWGQRLNAAEGMWLPILLEKYNISQMQELGFKLTAEDIYSVNQACLKDAVAGLVRVNNPFRNFCTAEVISDKGLLLTNHHCAYRTIQQHSSVEADYLTNGFWAMQPSDELQAQGIGVAFLKRMDDVTSRVLQGTQLVTQPNKIDSIIAANIAQIETQTTAETGFLAQVKPLFSGNQYILTTLQLFTDVRLVGAPPSAIGKFGGDTDNWMWPRHTGDFALYRIYADTLNQPAAYSALNQPYKPIKHFELSLKGVQPGNFTMVMGFPGTTNEYLPAAGVAQLMHQINPKIIEINGIGLNIMDRAMESNPAIRIQYASKAASLANGWKKTIGENRGLKRLNAVERKREFESGFKQWYLQNDTLQRRYGHILMAYDSLYAFSAPYNVAGELFWESVMACELINLARSFSVLFTLNKSTDTAFVNTEISKLKAEVTRFFKDYHQPTDRQLFEANLSYYHQTITQPSFQIPALNNALTKHKGNWQAYTNWVFETSLLANQQKALKYLTHFKPGSIKQLKTDPVMVLFVDAATMYNQNIASVLGGVDDELNQLNKLYLEAQFLYQPQRHFYPDANSTFRISYGQVADYEPADAVKYHYRTTLQGIIEKNNPEIYDYSVPDKLLTLYQQRNFGAYADADGQMPVCFIASNHTTGGYSGSPVINAQGQLIGINFDRNWEGTMSDIMYDPQMCRNIVLDVRYIMFIIDKYANAGYLLNELTIVN